MDTKDLVQQIKFCLPKRRPIHHHEPFIDKKNAYETVLDCISKGVTSHGYVDEFEKFIKDYTKADYALCTNTGTAALHLALLACGVKYGDEVIVPTSTFVATANAVSYIGAVPHFIDSSPHIDPEHLRTYLKSICKPNHGGRGSLHTKTLAPITALIVVHLLGFPSDIERLCEVAKEFNLVVIEDASQALGTTLRGKHLGTFGWAGTFSFNNNKLLTANGGGALITNVANIYYEAKMLGSTARTSHTWLVEHDSLAFNYRMGNINAALALSQTHTFYHTLLAKRALRARYLNHVRAEFVSTPLLLDCEPNYWLNTILVDNRDELLAALHAEGIQARAFFTPLHTLKFYQYSLPLYTYQSNIADDNMEKAEQFFKRAVCLPSGGGL